MPTAQTGGLACDTVCIDACLEPGNYYFLIEPSGPAGSVNCANGDYVASLQCQPCIACPVCDPAGLQEGEPCPNYPDTYNSGCTAAGEFATPIQCGVDVCGTSWAHPLNPSYNVQDVDVYELVLTQFDSVVWRVFANVPAQIFITEPLPGCGGEIMWAASPYKQKCDTLIASACLPPGRYWLKVTPYSLPNYCEPYTARVDCYPCSPGCVQCPLSGNARPEGEPCPNWNDQYNAGCFSTPPSAVHVQCSDTICGSSIFVDIPDRDFYELNITTRDTVTWCVTADFAVAAAITTPNANCSAMIVHAQGNAPACVPLCLSVCLDPGTYWLSVRPVTPADFPYPQSCKPYVASVHCAPCPTGQTCTYANLDFDPSNNACSFNNIQVSCNDTLCGVIIPGAAPDNDWYTFEVPAGTPCVQIVANVLGDDTPGFFPFGQGLDPAIAIYQADCTTLLGQDNNGGVGNDAQLTTTCLPPGWYHIRIGGVQGTTGPYILTLTCLHCACPPPCPYQRRDFEPANNSCATAPAEFVCGDTLCGDIPLGPSVDEDWYMFWVFGPQCQRLTLDVFANGTPGYFGYLAGLNPVVELWDATCSTQLALDDNSGVSNDAKLITACLTPGLYYVRVAGVAGTTGPYILAADCQFCSCSNQCPFPDLDFDPGNDVCNPFVTLSCTDTICGDLLPSNNGLPPDPADWYQVFVPAGSCMSLAVDVFANSTPAYTPFGGGLDPAVWLYGSDCVTMLEFDFDSGIGSDSRLVSGCLAPGTYNLLVNSPSGSSGPYVLAINCTQCTCPCSLDCPVGIPSEGEPCPNLFSSFNEGCLTNPPLFSPMTCNSTWCGESWAMGGLRDTDWYELNLAVSRRIKWSVSAEFPFEMAIYKPNPNCSSLQTIRYATAGPCESRQVIAKCLAPGTYYFYVAPTVYNGVPCGSDYRSRVQCGKCFLDHVVIHLEAASIKLNWEPDDTNPVFVVHRGTSTDFEPNEQTIIGSTQENFFEDTDVISTGQFKYFYVVTMESPDVQEP